MISKADINIIVDHLEEVAILYVDKDDAWLSFEEQQIRKDYPTMHRSIAAAADILRHLTYDQIEALPSYLRR